MANQVRKYDNWHTDAQFSRDKVATARNAEVSGYSWRFPFGMHKGKQIVAVPMDYLRFIRRKSNNMEVVRRCAEEMERRIRTLSGSL